MPTLTLDVGELPLFRVEFPGTVSGLAYLFQRHVGDCVLPMSAGQACGFGADIWHRGVSRRRIYRPRL